MMSLTAEQAALYQFIAKRMHDTGGVAPSYVEMAEHLGLCPRSKACIHRLMVALEERGVIKRFPKKARAIELIHAADAFTCPSCGYRTSNSHSSLPASGLKPALCALEADDDAVDAVEFGSAG